MEKKQGRFEEGFDETKQHMKAIQLHGFKV
jgi:hypothetical protein